VINDLGDNSEFTRRRTVIDEYDTTDLDESLEGGGSLNGSHLYPSIRLSFWFVVVSWGREP